MTTTRTRWALTAVTGVILAAMVAVLASTLERGAADTPSVMMARPAPPLAGPTLSGGHADLGDLRGRTVVVTVWASWCAPCRGELPLLADLQRRDPAVEFLGILTRDSAPSARLLQQQTGTRALTSVLDPDGTIAIDWGATGVPETFLVDGSGQIRARRVGAVTADWLSTELQQMRAG